MTAVLPHGRTVLTANEAAAHAVMLARAQLIRAIRLITYGKARM